METKTHTYNSINYVLLNCFSAVLSILAYSFGVNNMNNPLHLMITVFEIPENQIGLYQGFLQSSVYVGCFFGSILGLYIVHLGNRVCFYAIDILIICGSSLLFIDEIHIFILGRVILGIGCGMAPSMTSYFLKQFCPIEIYGLLAGLNPTLYSIGLIFTQIMGLFFQKDIELSSEVNNYWRYYFTVFPISICLIRICLLKFVMKNDTPLYYVMISDNDKAVEVLNKIYKPEYVQDIFEQIQHDCDTQKHKKSILGKPYARAFYFGLFLQLLTANSGYNVITQFSTDIFNDIFSESTAEVLTLMIAVVKFTFYTICFTLTQKYGRRKLFICGNFVMLCMNFSIGFLSLRLTSPGLDPDTTRYLQYTIVFFIYIYFIANFLSLPPLVSIYLPEILPSTAVQYTWVLYWGCQIYILLLFPIIKKAVGISYCFFYFGIFNIMGQVMIHFYLVETKDATQKMIQDFYYPKANQVQQIQNADVSRSTLLSYQD